MKQTVRPGLKIRLTVTQHFLLCFVARYFPSGAVLLAMLSNVTKSADVLRGATEMQDVWMEVEKEQPIRGLPPPKQMQNHVMVSSAQCRRICQPAVLPSNGVQCVCDL